MNNNGKPQCPTSYGMGRGESSVLRLLQESTSFDISREDSSSGFRSVFAVVVLIFFVTRFFLVGCCRSPQGSPSPLWLLFLEFILRFAFSDHEMCAKRY